MCPALLRPADESPVNWRELYAAAILEINKEKLLERIHAATAICDRADQLKRSGSSADERIALNRAMNVLSVLQGIYFGDRARVA